MAVLSLVSLLALAGPALANDIATWWGLSGAQIQSKIFLYGGSLSWGNWSAGSSSFPDAAFDPETATGVLYEIDLNQSINTQTAASDYVLRSPGDWNIPQYPGYGGGAMFSNLYSWFSFAGLALEAVTQPEVSTIIRGMEFNQAASAFQVSVQPNQPANSPVQGFSQHIALGSYTSSPDQGLGWWFGGLTSPNTSSPILQSPTDDSTTASVTSRIFIEATLAMDGNKQISFTYGAIPSWLEERTESALVWLPYGQSGMLLLMGGVYQPADFMTQVSGQPANNTYMTDLAIYDIANQTWYNQSTLETKTERPGQMAGFCTAVVPTEDGYGHEVFVYGGYDGTYHNSNPFDDVWVLSIPAFQWTKVYSGTPGHARQSSICFAPNPSTLITIGGSGGYGAPLSSNTGVDIFDLNALNWSGKYDPTSSAALKIPDAVVQQIKGYSVNGPGADAQVSGLSNNVTTLISKPYQGKLSSYYPYASATTSTGPSASNSTTPGTTPSHKSNTALIAALATVIPVVVIAAAILAFCCMRKRRKNQEGVERTQASRGNVSSWLRKSSAIDPPTDKSHTSDETAVGTEYTHDKQPISEVYEAPGSSPTTPGWGTHGSPRVLSGSMATSPFMGSAEVDAQSRHEIMDHAPRDGQSLRQHHMYPRSLSGDQVMSVRSDSISHASTGVMPSRHYGYVSPYEMAHDRSNEDLATPPADVTLGAPRAEANPNASTHSLGVGAEHVHSPVALLPVAPFQRKPVDRSAAVEDDRPRHQRNQSSMSSDLPNLPSPGPEEDRRRSRLIDTLPDPKSGQTSPIQPQTAKKSVYTENLDA